MALDVYVMPLWRFKAGFFTTALERALPGQSKVLTPEGVMTPGYRWKRLCSLRARWEVHRLQRTACRQLGAQIHWRDDGPIIHAQQAAWGFSALRTFAKWIDFLDEYPTLAGPEDGDCRGFYNHPVFMRAIDRALSFPQIVKHDCFAGYFVPCDFGEVISVEPHRVSHWSFTRSMGSTLGLDRELQGVQMHLQNQELQRRVTNPDAWRFIELGYNTLRTLCDKSLESQLPIIFYG